MFNQHFAFWKICSSNHQNTSQNKCVQHTSPQRTCTLYIPKYMCACTCVCVCVWVHAHMCVGGSITCLLSLNSEENNIFNNHIALPLLQLYHVQICFEKNNHLILASEIFPGSLTFCKKKIHWPITVCDYFAVFLSSFALQTPPPPPQPDSHTPHLHQCYFSSHHWAKLLIYAVNSASWDGIKNLKKAFKSKVSKK